MRHVARLTVALVLVFCIGLTGCGGGGSKTTNNPPAPVVLSSITVTTTTASVIAGATAQFTATGKYSDGTSKDLTTTATWTSSAAGIATVSTAGMATSIAPGSTDITATSGGISGKATLTVTAPSVTAIAVTASATTIPMGAGQQLVATGTYNNNTTGDISGSATWTSSDPTIVSISSTGMATAKAATGTVTATASLGSVTSPALTLTVANPAPKTLLIMPASPTIAVNQWFQPKAYLVYTDNTALDVTPGTPFTVADPTVLNLSSQFAGTVSGKTAGTSKLTATNGSLTASTNVTVSGKLTTLTVSPSTATIHQGGEVLFTGAGTFDSGTSQTPLKFTTWGVDNTAVADFVGPLNGGLSGITPGTVNVTASLGGILGTPAKATVDAFALQSLAVAPASLDMAVHVGQQLTATGTFSDGSTTVTQDFKNVTWDSSDVTVATVDANGFVQSVAPGVATITATLPGGKTQTVGVNVAHGVFDHITITSDKASPKAGDVVQFTAIVTLADGRTFDVTPIAIWTSSDSSVALVDVKGKMTLLKAGTVNIETVYHNTTTTTITVAP